MSSVFVKAYTLNVQLETEQGVVRNDDSEGGQTRVGDDQDTCLVHHGFREIKIERRLEVPGVKLA